MATRAAPWRTRNARSNAAPQNPDLWFTLAYAARLSGQYSQSVDAYQRGLQLKPSSVEGLSGLAQTYARMGRSADAQKTLEAALAANPKSDVDLQLAGELLLPTDPERAIDYLQRSEAVKVPRAPSCCWRAPTSARATLTPRTRCSNGRAARLQPILKCCAPWLRTTATPGNRPVVDPHS